MFEILFFNKYIFSKTLENFEHTFFCLKLSEIYAELNDREAIFMRTAIRTYTAITRYIQGIFIIYVYYVFNIYIHLPE